MFVGSLFKTTVYMGRTTKILYSAFIVLVVLIAGTLLFSMFPVEGNIQIKIVQSGSMEPAIKTGSLVVVKPSDSYVVGDVITFGADTRTEVPISHRIVEMRVEDGKFLYRVKGDANNAEDPTEVKEEDVIGKVVFDIPYVGYILDFARTPVGFILIVGVPAGIVIFDEIAKIFIEARNQIRRKKESVNQDKNDKEVQ